MWPVRTPDLTPAHPHPSATATVATGHLLCGDVAVSCDSHSDPVRQAHFCASTLWMRKLRHQVACVIAKVTSQRPRQMGPTLDCQSHESSHGSTDNSTSYCAQELSNDRDSVLTSPPSRGGWIPSVSSPRVGVATGGGPFRQAGAGQTRGMAPSPLLPSPARAQRWHPPPPESAFARVSGQVVRVNLPPAPSPGSPAPGWVLLLYREFQCWPLGSHSEVSGIFMSP